MTENLLLNRTWSVRKLSPFAKTMMIGNSSHRPKNRLRDSINSTSSRKRKRQSTSVFVVGDTEMKKTDYGEEIHKIDHLVDNDDEKESESSGNCMLKDLLEKELTLLIQQNFRQEEMYRNISSNKSSSRRKEEDDDKDDFGNFVLVSWVHLSTTAIKKTETQIGSNTSTTRSNNNKKELQKHLHVQVYLQDELSAQIVLCFPTYTTQDIHDRRKKDGRQQEIQSFSFILIRGSQDGYSPILQYLESNYGCVISTFPFRFSPSDLTNLLAYWTVIHLFYNNNGKDSDTLKTNNSNRRPLEITFATPSEISNKGLSRITLNIPTVALKNVLFGNSRETVEEQKNRITSILSIDLDSLFPSKSLLKILHKFFYDTFHIDVSSLPLLKVSCTGVCVMDLEGRCKFFDIEQLGCAFHMLRILVTRKNE